MELVSELLLLVQRLGVVLGSGLVSALVSILLLPSELLCLQLVVLGLELQLVLR
jgi:hypothetical protein